MNRISLAFKFRNKLLSTISTGSRMQLHVQLLEPLGFVSFNAYVFAH